MYGKEEQEYICAFSPAEEIFGFITKQLYCSCVRVFSYTLFAYIILSVLIDSFQFCLPGARVPAFETVFVV